MQLCILYKPSPDKLASYEQDRRKELLWQLLSHFDERHRLVKPNRILSISEL